MTLDLISHANLALKNDDWRVAQKFPGHIWFETYADDSPLRFLVTLSPGNMPKGEMFEYRAEQFKFSQALMNNIAIILWGKSMKKEGVVSRPKVRLIEYTIPLPSPKRWQRPNIGRGMAASDKWRLISGDDMQRARDAVRTWIEERLITHFGANQNQAKEYTSRLDKDFFDKCIKIASKNKRGY
jgi:hypothetical protein